MSRWLRLVVLAIAALCLVGSIDASPTYAYDVPAASHAAVREFGAVGTTTALRSGADGCVSRPVAARGASTTSSRSFIATNKAFASVDDLTGSTLSNYNRFVKNLPAAAETPTIRNLADGAVEFSAKVPATNIPGSYATYTKFVSSDGITTSFIKTTIAPDGSVVSVKVKFP